MTLAADDRIAELLEEAARLADLGDAAQAGGLASEAAALLPAGDPDRHSTFASAAVLLAAAGRHAMAAEAWAAAAADAPDDHIRVGNLTAEGRDGSSPDTAIIALNRRALAVLRSSVDPRHPLLRTIEDNLATAPQGIDGRRRSDDL